MKYRLIEEKIHFRLVWVDLINFRNEIKKLGGANTANMNDMILGPVTMEGAHCYPWENRIYGKNPLLSASFWFVCDMNEFSSLMSLNIMVRAFYKTGQIIITYITKHGMYAILSQIEAC